LNPCPRRVPRKPLHVYPALKSEEPTLHRRTTSSRASAISILRIKRGRSADSPACCPRFRRQQASLRKRHGQLSRESEIFVICVYLFWSGFLRGQRTILDMPPALLTMSRSQCAPVREIYSKELYLQKGYVDFRCVGRDLRPATCPERFVNILCLLFVFRRV